jgi:two-component system, LytTR family, sensor kinase
MKRSLIVLLHAGYWALYVFLLLFILLAISANQYSGPPTFPGLVRMLFVSPFAAFTLGPALAGFYSFYFILFPKFLKQRKIPALVFVGLLFVFLCALATGAIMSALFSSRLLFFDGWSSAAGITIVMSSLALIHGAIALVIRGFVSWYGDIRVKEELNRKNFEMELALVRSQLNPHFLFNTINNIDVLIEKDAAKASAYLNKLSDIMRFMLYETKTGKIPLSKELAYIEKYIDLQKIRTSNPDYVSFEVSGDAGGFLTEPMLYIPFIENAFKHAENKKQEHAIRIRFSIEKEKIGFSCENHYTLPEQPSADPGGLGNELIRKRLGLLYPGKHTLDIVRANGIYKVALIVERDEDEMHHR